MRRRPLTLLLALPVLAVLLVAAGCGGSSNASAPTPASVSGTQTSTTPSGGRGRFDNTKFTSCLADQGVKLPSRPSGGFGQGGSPQGQPPAGGAGSFGDPKTRKAFQKCRQFLPNGGRFGGGSRPGVNSQAFAKYRQCLTAHGVKLTGGGTFGGANVASPAFQKAAKACRQYAPRFGATGGTQPPSSG